MDKPKRDFLAARNILRANIALFHQGHADVYRVVGTELRKLLCDRPRSLVDRLFPRARLHPTPLYMPGEDLTHLAFQIPVSMHFDGKGGVQITQVFERRRQPIPLAEWLDQPLLNSRITVRYLIKSVADKEGAHADPELNDALHLATSIHIADEELLGRLMVAIGEYVLSVLDMAVAENPAVFGKSAQ